MIHDRLIMIGSRSDRDEVLDAVLEWARADIKADDCAAELTLAEEAYQALAETEEGRTQQLSHGPAIGPILPGERVKLANGAFTEACKTESEKRERALELARKYLTQGCHRRASNG